MAAPEPKRDSPFSVQIVVAIIGVLGVVVAALIGNWGNIFPKPSSHPVSGGPPIGTSTGTSPSSPPRPVNAPVVHLHSKGQLVVRGTWRYDLDSGIQTNTGADFWWNLETNVKRDLVPLNGAVFSVVGIRDFESLSLRDIERLDYSSRTIDGSNATYNQIPQGTVVAYKTNEGRRGKFIVDEYGSNLTIRWKTYE